MTPPEPIVIADELGFAYPGGPPTLKGVSFRIDAGERIAVVGPSGAGKSTLLLLLAGLLPDPVPRSAPERPPLTLFGEPVTRSTLLSIRPRIGVVFQNPDDQLFRPTVGEDVAFGPANRKLSRDEVNRRVADSLARVGLVGFESRPVLGLSYGERKRVALAGVLACAPDLLLLDEPFSNLDPRSRRELTTILTDLPATLVIATHELPHVVGLCERTLVLDHRTLRADGPTEEVLSNDLLMQRHGLEVPWQLRSR